MSNIPVTGLPAPPPLPDRRSMRPIDRFKSRLGTVLFVLVILVTVLQLLGLGMYQLYYVPSGSMIPTLQINDRVLCNKLAYRLSGPRDGDIVIFAAPPRAIATSSGLPTGVGSVDFIKRCIGVPGDVVYIVKGKLYRAPGGVGTPKLVPEPYAQLTDDGVTDPYDMKVIGGHVYMRELLAGNQYGDWTMESSPNTVLSQTAITMARPQAVPQNEYLVLGDNRSDSNDSHSFGFVPRANFKGKVSEIVWPPSHLRKF